MRGGVLEGGEQAELDGGKKRRKSRSRSRRRSHRRSRMRGGVTGGETAVVVGAAPVLAGGAAAPVLAGGAAAPVLAGGAAAPVLAGGAAPTGDAAPVLAGGAAPTGDAAPIAGGSTTEPTTLVGGAEALTAGDIEGGELEGGKRKLSAYNRFVKKHYKSVKRKHPRSSPKTILRMIAKMWRK